MEQHSLFLENRSDRYRRKIILFAGVGFFAGVFLANTLCKKKLMSLGIFGDYFFMQVERVEITGNTLFLYVLEKRMFLLVLLAIAAVIEPGSAVVCVIAGWIGTGGGMLLSAAAIQQGIRGIGICLAGMLPHYLLYLPAGLYLMIQSCRLSGMLHGKTSCYPANLKKAVRTYLGRILLVFAVFFAGIALESYLNPIFLQKIYKIFNNI